VPKLVGARRASVIWPQSRGVEISAPMETCAGVGTRPGRALREFASRQPAIIIVGHQNRYVYQNKYIYWSLTGCQQISATPAFAFCLTQNQFFNQGEGLGAGVSVDRDGKPRKISSVRSCSVGLATLHSVPKATILFALDTAA
jgi:hypothetical protein